MKFKQDPYQVFLDLIHEHQGILLRLCSVYASRLEDREDLYQEMLLQAWRTFRTYDRRSRFSTWLYRVGLNTALMARRREKRNVSDAWDAAQIQDLAAVRPDDGLQPEIELLYGCIRELPSLDRAIVLLHLERHNNTEIADIVGLSSGTISVRIVRIKEKLRKLMSAKEFRGT